MISVNLADRFRRRKTRSQTRTKTAKQPAPEGIPLLQGNPSTSAGPPAKAPKRISHAKQEQTLTRMSNSLTHAIKRVDDLQNTIIEVLQDPLRGLEDDALPASAQAVITSVKEACNVSNEYAILAQQAQDDEDYREMLLECGITTPSPGAAEGSDTDTVFDEDWALLKTPTTDPLLSEAAISKRVCFAPGDEVVTFQVESPPQPSTSTGIENQFPLAKAADHLPSLAGCNPTHFAAL